MQTRFFVNLPVSYIGQDHGYLSMFLAGNIRPELGFDPTALDMVPDEEHHRIRSLLLEKELIPGAHLPFFDLAPGSKDAYILAATRSRLASGLDKCRYYGAAHMVAHPSFLEHQHRQDFQAWLETSTQTWCELLDTWPDHPPLYLENTFETDPTPLVQLVEQIRVHHPQVGICFDVGHWHSFGRGVRAKNLHDWLDILKPYLRHVHLHDNNGEGDQHLALGKGTIPLEQLLRWIEDQPRTIGVTLEPHTVQDFTGTEDFAAQWPQIFGPWPITY